MEDKKVMKFINDNHEKEYNDYKKQLKRGKRKEKVLSTLYIIVLITVIILFVKLIQNDTKRAIARCVNEGNDYQYCVRVSQ